MFSASEVFTCDFEKVLIRAKVIHKCEMAVMAVTVTAMAMG